MQFFRASEVDTVQKVEEEARQVVEEMRRKLHQFQDSGENQDQEESGDDDASQDGSEASSPSSAVGGGDLEDLAEVQEVGGADFEEPASRDALDWYIYIMKSYHGSIPQRMRAVAYERW